MSSPAERTREQGKARAAKIMEAHSIAPVLDAFDAAEQAVRSLNRAINGYNDTIRDAGRAMRDAGVYAVPAPDTRSVSSQSELDALLEVDPDNFPQLMHGGCTVGVVVGGVAHDMEESGPWIGALVARVARPNTGLPIPFDPLEEVLTAARSGKVPRALKNRDQGSVLR